MGDIKFKVGTCPHCHKTFPMKYAFEPRIDEEEISDLLRKYNNIEKYIKYALTLSVKQAEERDYTINDLQRLLYFIWKEHNGSHKFLKALKIYYDKNYHKENKGLAYFLAMAKNMEINEGEFGYGDSSSGGRANFQSNRGSEKESPKGVGKFY